MIATWILSEIVQKSIRGMLRKDESKRGLPVGVWVKTKDGWRVWAKGAGPGWRHVRVERADGSFSVERITSTQERFAGRLYTVAAKEAGRG